MCFGSTISTSILCWHMVYIMKCIKMYEDIFTESELFKLTDYINELRVAGRNGKLSGLPTSKNWNFSFSVNEASKQNTTDVVPSNVTKQRVAAAKQYIEKHYKEQMKNLQEIKERYDFSLII
ncbi:hypothetical protein Scep_007603 [Stephania cephalantha]|uniref:Uncharacterized protein n=1 Tax=Stephania cephalantha TaxID=152367 RepID=A0AAP0KA90_9MAGN